MVDAAANATLRQLDGGVTSEAEMVELHSTDAANGGPLALFAEAMGGAETQQEQLATEALARRGGPGAARASRRASSWHAGGFSRMTAAAFRLHGLGGWRYSARARSEIPRRWRCRLRRGLSA